MNIRRLVFFLILLPSIVFGVNPSKKDPDNPPKNPDDVNPCKKTSEPGDDNSKCTLGSFMYTLEWGGIPGQSESALESGTFIIRENQPSPAIFSPGVVYYQNPAAIKLTSLVNDAGTISASITGADSLPVKFVVAAGQSIGGPSEQMIGLNQRLMLIDDYGHPLAAAAGVTPRGLRIIYPNGSSVYISTVTNIATSFKTAGGRDIVFSGLPLETALKLINSDGALRQIKAAAGLADLVPLGALGFQIRLYAPGGEGAIDSDTALYVPTGTPTRTIFVENPNTPTEDYGTIKVTDTWGSQAKISTFYYNTVINDWTLNRGTASSDPSTLRNESKTLVPGPNPGEVTYHITLSDGAGVLVSSRNEIYHTYPWGKEKITEVLEPGTLSLVTTYQYNEAPALPGYGKLCRVDRSDGSWETYEYSSAGRMLTKSAPWKDSAIKTVTYDFASLDGADSVAAIDFRPRTETETVVIPVDGVMQSFVVGCTYHVYKSAANGQTTEIEERASSVTSAYGSTTNLRTTRVYCTTDTTQSGYSAVSAGKLSYEDLPDGTRTTYTYTENTTTPTAAFTTTTTFATASSPTGVDGLSTRIVSTYDLQGRLVRTQSFIFANAAWQASSDAVDTINTEGQTTARTINGRQVYAATYEGRHKMTETDEYGIVTAFQYDGFDKVYIATRKGVAASGSYAAQADITTKFQRSLGGLSCGCDGEVVTTVSSGGLSLSNTMRKDQIGRMVYEKDNAGLETNYIYTLGGRQVTRLNPDGGTVVTLNYKDGRAQSESGTGTNARTYDYGVNSDGTQWTEVALGMRKERTTYDFLGRTVKSEQPAYGGGTLVTASIYDAQGRLGQIRHYHVVGSTETNLIANTLYNYDVLGNLTRTGLDINGDGVLTLASADRLTETQTTFAQYESAWWSVHKTLVYPTLNSGTPIQVSETRQRLSGLTGTLAEDSVTIDISGNLSRRQTNINLTGKLTNRTVTRPDSNITATQVAYNGLVVAENPATVATATTYTYDPLGRIVSAKEPRKAHAETTVYDPANGQITVINDAAGNPTTVAYYPNGVAGAGRPSAVTDALGKTKRVAYDLHGRPIYQWGTAVYPQSVSYNALGSLATSTTWRDTAADLNTTAWPMLNGGDVTTWTYDLSSAVLTRKAYADGNGTDYTYDKANRPYTRVWSRSVSSVRVTTTLGYDPASGDLAALTYSDDTPSVTISYDRLGRQSAITDAAGSRTFNYDPAKLVLSSETLPAPYYGSRVLTYDYQSAGTGLLPGRFGGYRLGTVSTPAQDFSASFGYDAQGRFSSVTSGAGGFTYGYTPSSNLLATLTGPKVTATYAYEPDRDVRTQIANAVGATSISRYTYEVDAIGRRSNRVQDGSAFAAATYDRFDYDNRNEVTGSHNYTGIIPANYLTDTQNTALARLFTYDPIGNRLSSTEGSTAARVYTPNTLNQYTAITNPSVVPTYDLDGNQTATGSGWYYTWDAENRLVNARNYLTTPVSGSQKLDFGYDYKSRRIRRTLSTYSGSAWSATDDRKFIYQGWNVVAELTASSNSLQTAYTWGLDLSQSQQGAGGVGGLLAVTTYSPSAASFFATYDGNGNVSEYVNSAGTVEAHFTYDAFGQTTVVSGTNLGRFAYRFSTKCEEPLLGLYYYDFRFYSPSLGRFNNRDSLEEIGGLNLFVMTDNDPINFFDPNGRKKTKPKNEPKLKYWDEHWNAFKDSHPGLTDDQYNWAEHQMARGCVGNTCANIGDDIKLDNCYIARAMAEAKQIEMAKNACCKPHLYSLHLWDELGRDKTTGDTATNYVTSEVDLSNWDGDGKTIVKGSKKVGEEGNFDYGYVNPDGSITHGNHMHNPNRKYFPDAAATSSKDPAIFITDTADDWSSKQYNPSTMQPTYGRGRMYNKEVWCVQCSGNYGKK
jgi:RHS repeat-associated protein